MVKKKFAGNLRRSGPGTSSVTLMVEISRVSPAPLWEFFQDEGGPVRKRDRKHPATPAPPVLMPGRRV